jgi:peptidoglycan hydrolase-like protein with peptidoglycan-binding domain
MAMQSAVAQTPSAPAQTATTVARKPKPSSAHATTKPSSTKQLPAKQSSARKTSTNHSSVNHSSVKHSSAHTAKSSRGKKVATKRGQQEIDPVRAREIQTALIRQNYMQGEPSGSWDAATQAAMRKFQADHGWQSKSIPDSRALIRLGLGPSSDHLLNPESAMTGAPAPGDPKPSDKQAPAGDSLPQQ